MLPTVTRAEVRNYAHQLVEGSSRNGVYEVGDQRHDEDDQQ